MAFIKRAQSGFRNVTVEFSNASTVVDGSETAQIAAPIDAFKAALRKVEELEGTFFLGGATAAPDLAAATVLTSGTRIDTLYQFTVTSTMATGAYVFIYVGEVDPSTL